MGPGFLAAALARFALMRLSGAGIFTAIWSFLGTPMGRVVAIGLAGVALYFVGDIRGRHAANVACEERVTAMIEHSKQEAEATDTKIKTEAQKFATEATAELKQLNQKLGEKVTAYEKTIQGKSNSCKLVPADVERLRKLL